LTCKKSARSKSVHQTVRANTLKKICGAIELLRHLPSNTGMAFCHCAASQSTPRQSIAKAARQSDGNAAHRATKTKSMAR
jgi:hypothetical protein